MKSKTAFTLAIGMGCLLWIPVFVQAEHALPPNGPPPMPTRAIVQEGTLFRLQPLFVPETRTRLVEVNGTKKEEAYTVMRPQFKVASTPNGGYRVFTVEGKALTEPEIAAALSKQTDVLIAMHGKLMDPRYRPLYAPENLVVYLKPEMAFPGFGAPQPPGNGKASPLPEFSLDTVPKSVPPTIGFLSRAGADVTVTEHRWDMIGEQKPVQVCVVDAEGKEKTVTKFASRMHFVPEPVETRYQLAELTTVNRAGERTQGLFDELTDHPTAVFLQDTGSEFDPAHFKLCQANVAVVQGRFPIERHQMNYSAPPAPTECFASIKEGQVAVARMVTESITVQVPVTVLKDGKEVTEYRTEAKTVSKFVHQSLPLDKVRAQDAGGKEIDSAELTKRLATQTPVMVATGDEPVSPLYLARLKPETIVLALPMIHAAGPAAPPPAPGAPQSSAPAHDGSGTVFVAAQVPAAVAPAAEAPPKAPAEGPPPRLVKIQSLGDKLVLREPRTQHGFPPVAAAPPGTKPATPKPRTFASWESRVLDTGDFRTFEADGRPLAAEVLAECGTRPLIALLSDHGKKVDPAWLSIFNGGTIVVYVRPQVMPFGQGGYGMPVGPPPVQGAPIPPPSAQPQSPQAPSPRPQPEGRPPMAPGN